MPWIVAFLISFSVAHLPAHSSHFKQGSSDCLTVSKVANPEITREEAIAIARKKGYYKTGKEWRDPSVELNTATMIWIITSLCYETTHKGDCKHTNGCTIVIRKTISIDAKTGKVIDKKKTRKKTPNYE